MSPFSGGVLGGAALVSAPALWDSVVLGTKPLADGLLTYVTVVLICWVALSVVVALVGPVPAAQESAQQPGSTTGSSRQEAGES